LLSCGRGEAWLPGDTATIARVDGAAGRCVDPSSAAGVDRERARVLGLGDEPTNWARGSGLFGYYLYIFHSRYTYIDKDRKDNKSNWTVEQRYLNNSNRDSKQVINLKKL